MRNSAIKITILLLIICPSVLLLKKNATLRDDGMLNPFQNANSSADTSLYFVGSSRVQKSIDPKLLQDHFRNFQVINLGISGGNFLSNCVMAEIVLKRPGNKVVFIELAPILDELPDGIYRVASQSDFSPSGSARAFATDRSYADQSRQMLAILNSELYKSVTIREEVFDILGLDVGKSNSSWIGFDPYDKNECDHARSFLTWQEIHEQTVPPVDLLKYAAMISRLEGLAKMNDSWIVFFLPITVREPVEKGIILPLYRTLPDPMKIEFTPGFLNALSQPVFLGDENHLNRRGAEVYSTMLIPLLETHLQTYKQAAPGTTHNSSVVNR
jgi:hypothetical protein